MAGVHFPSFFLVFVSIASMSRVQGCRVADAALSYDDTNYIFVGHDFITLKNDNSEDKVENKNDAWNGLERLDAALNWVDGSSWYSSWYPKFFEGSSYSYYSYFRGSTYGPYVVEEDDSEEDKLWNGLLKLDQGFDAAATCGKKSIFFKCCNYIVYDHQNEEVAKTGPLEEYGLPCNVHAALTLKDGVVGIIKFDQLWEYNLKFDNVTGPVDANEAFQLKTISLCGEHEDADDAAVPEA